MMTDLELDVFPEGLFGGGHPLCIAYLIMQVYSSHAEAITRPEGATYCKALCDQRIPGTGSNVWKALDMLKRAELEGIEAAMEWAQEYWEKYSDTSAVNQARGTEQAQALRERFLEAYDHWSAVIA